MNNIIFKTKEQLYLLCKDICAVQHDFYKNSCDIIEQRGAAVKIGYLFGYSGKYNKTPNLDKTNSLIVCTSIYPASISLFHAENTHVCQCYYSKVGVIKKRDNDTYLLHVNESEDKGMTFFLKRYRSRLSKKNAVAALKHRIADIVTNGLFPKRLGSSFNKTYRGFPIKGFIVIILLILLFLIRLIIPSGYHPSLHPEYYV